MHQVDQPENTMAGDAICQVRVNDLQPGVYSVVVSAEIGECCLWLLGDGASWLVIFSGGYISGP